MKHFTKIFLTVVAGAMMVNPYMQASSSAGSSSWRMDPKGAWHKVTGSVSSACKSASSYVSSRLAAHPRATKCAGIVAGFGAVGAAAYAGYKYWTRNNISMDQLRAILKEKEARSAGREVTLEEFESATKPSRFSRAQAWAQRNKKPLLATALAGTGIIGACVYGARTEHGQALLTGMRDSFRNAGGWTGIGQGLMRNWKPLAGAGAGVGAGAYLWNRYDKKAKAKRLAEEASANKIQRFTKNKLKAKKERLAAAKAEEDKKAEEAKRLAEEARLQKEAQEVVAHIYTAVADNRNITQDRILATQKAAQDAADIFDVDDVLKPYLLAELKKRTQTSDAKAKRRATQVYNVFNQHFASKKK